MTRSVLFVLCFLCLASPPASLQPSEWKDPSPHKSTFVTVEEGVQLEVLDWEDPVPRSFSSPVWAIQPTFTMTLRRY